MLSGEFFAVGGWESMGGGIGEGSIGEGEGRRPGGGAAETGEARLPARRAGGLRPGSCGLQGAEGSTQQLAQH